MSILVFSSHGSWWEMTVVVLTLQTGTLRLREMKSLAQVCVGTE